MCELFLFYPDIPLTNEACLINELSKGFVLKYAIRMAFSFSVPYVS